jgi:flagellin
VAAGTTGLTAAEVATLGAGAGLSVADIKSIGGTITINDSTVVEIAAGTALTSVVSRINAALEADELDVKASFKADTTGSDLNHLILSNTTFGSQLTTVKSTRTSTLDYSLGVGTSVQNVHGKDIAGTINGVKSDGAGQFLVLTSAGDNANGIRVKFTGASTPTDGTLKATVTQDSLLFQVGANSGQSVKQAINDVRSNKLGRLATGLITTAKSIADIDVTTQDGAKDALKLVDDAISSIITQRGNLGAFQANVLESNINSLSVAKENLSAAESAIRNADFAAETVQFIRNQILLQAGTAILTQANAIPQAVLQLLA